MKPSVALPLEQAGGQQLMPACTGRISAAGSRATGRLPLGAALIYTRRDMA